MILLYWRLSTLKATLIIEVTLGIEPTTIARLGTASQPFTFDLPTSIVCLANGSASIGRMGVVQAVKDSISSTIRPSAIANIRTIGVSPFHRNIEHCNVQ